MRWVKAKALKMHKSNQYNAFKNYTFKIKATSPRDQWIKISLVDSIHAQGCNFFITGFGNILAGNSTKPSGDTIWTTDWSFFFQWVFGHQQFQNKFYEWETNAKHLWAYISNLWTSFSNYFNNDSARSQCPIEWLWHVQNCFFFYAEADIVFTRFDW